MTDFLWLSRFYPQLRERPGRPVVVASILAAAAALLAGCGTQSAGMTPRQAVDAAAMQAGNVRSATATITEQVGGSTGETIAGKVTEQLKPTLLMSMSLSIGTGGAPGQTIGGIINSKAIYLHSSAFGKAAGKPWIEVPFSILGGASSGLGQLFKSLSKINPARQVQLFSGARNVRNAGTEVIGGVRTTHYAGTLSPSAGLAALPPSLRKEFRAALKSISGDIRFSLWVDSQHQIRKAVETETLGGQSITTTIVFSAINQPVHITLPAPSQVAVIPGSALGTA